MTEAPVRILHVVGGMNRGGAETWLMHVLRHIDRERFRMDFLVHTTDKCAFDDEIRALGSEVIPCLHPSRPFTYARNLRRILRERGPYDVVHSHVHHFSGWVLRVAAKAGVPKRIAHSHSNTVSVEAGGWRRRAYLRLMKRFIRKHATAGIGVSEGAAASLFGADWKRDSRWRVVPVGIDLEPFKVVVDRAEVRRELGIPEAAFVVGHVGRFHPAKNHTFLLDVFAEVVKLRPEALLLLVGDGPLRGEIEAKARRLGLNDRVVMTGVRDDVPRLMKGAMDVFVFPSHHEGLGLVVLEAQAAGVPCVVSQNIPGEATLSPAWVQRLTLGQTAHEWGQAIAVCTERVPAEASLILRDRGFDVGSTVTGLTGAYV